MLENKDHIINLIGKHFRNELAPEEKRELEEWLSEKEAHRLLFSQFTNDDVLVEKMRLYKKSEMSADAWDKIEQHLNINSPIEKKTNTFWTKMLAAAMIIAITSGTAWLVIKNINKAPPPAISPYNKDSRDKTTIQINRLPYGGYISLIDLLDSLKEKMTINAMYRKEIVQQLGDSVAIKDLPQNPDSALLIALRKQHNLIYKFKSDEIITITKIDSLKENN